MPYSPSSQKERQRIQFVSTFYLMVLGAMLVYLPVRLVIDPAFLKNITFVVGVVFLYSFGYFASRRGYVWVGVGIVVASFSLGMMVLAWLRPEEKHILFLLSIPVLISSTVLSRKITLGVFAFQLIGMSLITALSADISSTYTVRPIGALVFISALAIAMASYLRSVNSDQEYRLKKIRDATVFAMAYQAEMRDETTGEHLNRMSRYVSVLAKTAMQTPEFTPYMTAAYTDDLSLASILHDVGKVGISDAILLKPGRLTDEEFALIKQHPDLGARTLEFARDKIGFESFYDLAISVVKSHHEKWDGSGYPEGLKGEEIPLSARIVAICDVYDALRSNRPYKKPFSHQQAVAVLHEGAGTHFSPKLIEIFARCAPKFERISQEDMEAAVSAGKG